MLKQEPAILRMPLTVASRRLFFRSFHTVAALVAATCSVSNVHAREERSTFQTYNADQGLESLGGACMVQDPAGFLLVCTEHGVFAYDGRRFINLGTGQGLRQGGFIDDIAITAAGRVAIAYPDEVLVSAGPPNGSHAPEALSFQSVMNAGATQYDERPHRLVPWNDGLVLLSADTIRRVVVPEGARPHLEEMGYGPKEFALLRGASTVHVAGGHLWAAFADGRICAAEPGHVRCYDASDGLRGGPWFDIATDGQGRILARSRGSVGSFDPAQERWSIVELPDQGGRYVNYHLKLGLFRTPDDTLITQADHGLAFLRPDGWHALSVEEGAPSGIIVSATTDATGQFWLQVLGRGLVRWLGYSHWETLQKSDGLSEGVPWQTARAPNGPVWVSTDTGVDELERQGASLRVARVFPGASFAIAAGPRGALWRSSGDDGARVVDPRTGLSTRIAVPPVNAIVPAPDGVVWLGTMGGLFKVVDRDGSDLKPQIEHGPVAPVVSIVPDMTGGAYYISAGHLRRRLSDGGDVAMTGAWPGNAFDPLALASSPREGSRDGDIWVGGAGGLYRLRVANGNVSSVSAVATSDTRTNSIVAVMVDHRGWVWAGTALGVSVFDGSRWVSVDTDRGLVSDDVDQLGIREDPDGSVWIVTSQGVSHLLDPAWLFEDHPLRATVSRAQLGTRPVVGQEIPYTEAALNLQFGTSNYGAERSVIFKYTLSGVDADLAESTSGAVRYPFVPPGHHVLTVYAYDTLTHRSSPPSTLSIDIGFPWWRRWWAELAATLCAAAFAYVLMRLRFRAMLARQVKLKQLVDQATEQLVYQAGHDSLTGLLNRSEIEKRLAGRLASVAVDNQALVALLDIDHFKRVNDDYGHLGGDDVLRRIGVVIGDAVRAGECAGRYGGEEMLLVLEDDDHCGVDRVLALHSAIRGARINAASGQTIHVTCSIGLAWAIRGDNWESLIGRADNALYEAKASGRDRVVESRQFSPETHPADSDLRRDRDRALQSGRPAFELQSKLQSEALTADLRTVDSDGEMELLYQPIVRIQHASGHETESGSPIYIGEDEVVGYEALLRWNHPTRGVIMPSEFVRLSEDDGSIGRLGTWVLNRACANAACWPADLTVAINVSPLQFRSGELLERVREALSESGIHPGRVELEITETAILVGDEAALRTLRQLHALGVKVALDDFGTGFSSLSYLRWFQFDRIKIDRSFVSDMCAHRDAAAITRTILGLGRSLNIPVTAEGVETAEQLAILRAEGCTHAQGYLFGRPAASVMVSSFATA